MSKVYDLHSHTRASDGEFSPSQLVAHAAAQGVDVLALTDHDTTDGLAEAATEAQARGLTLVPGVEVSVTWMKATVHIVGLGVDAGNTELQTGLAGLREFREWRGGEIARRLEKAGIPGALAGAQAYANGRILSRTHFAHFLVAQGHASTVRDVFKRFLVNNKPGHVPGAWAELEQAVQWITAAGGQAVVAHPARYKYTGAKLRRLLGEFLDVGGVAMEVVSGSHSKDDVMNMGNHCRNLGLLASVGSDFHGPSNPWCGLGRVAPLPGGCVPIWSQWSFES